MAKEKLNRRGLRPSAKVPLTYYRSARGSASSDSPFEKRPSIKPSKSRKILIGVADIILLGLIIVGLVYALLVKPDPAVKLNNNTYHSAQTYKIAINSLFG